MTIDAGVQAANIKVSSLLQQARELSVHGNNAKARRLFEEALALAETLDDQLGKGNALKGRGFLNSLDGYHAEARVACEEALKLFRHGGYRMQEAYTLMALGNQLNRVNKAEANSFFQAAANIFRALGMSAEEAFARHSTLVD